jgi:hypothetical protein
VFGCDDSCDDDRGPISSLVYRECGLLVACSVPSSLSPIPDLHHRRRRRRRRRRRCPTEVDEQTTHSVTGKRIVCFLVHAYIGPPLVLDNTMEHCSSSSSASLQTTEIEPCFDHQKKHILLMENNPNTCSSLAFDRDEDDTDDGNKTNVFAKNRQQQQQHGSTSFSSYLDNNNNNNMTDVKASVSISMTSFTCGSSSGRSTTTNENSMDAWEDDANWGSGWSSMEHQDTNHSATSDAKDSSEVWVTHLFTSSSSSKFSPATVVPLSSSSCATPSTTTTRRGVLPPPTRTCPTSYQQAYYDSNRIQTTTTILKPDPHLALEDTRCLTNDEWMERRERRYRSLSTMTTTTTTSHRQAPMPHLLVSEQDQTPPVTLIHSENTGVDQVVLLLDYSADSRSTLPHHHHHHEEEEDDRSWRRPIHRQAQSTRSRLELLQHWSSTVGRTCRHMIYLPWHILRHSESRIHRATAAATTAIFREEGARRQRSRTWNNRSPPPTTATATMFEWPDELELRNGDNDDTATAYWSTGTRMCDDLSHGSSSNNEGA